MIRKIMLEEVHNWDKVKIHQNGESTEPSREHKAPQTKLFLVLSVRATYMVLHHRNSV